MMLSRDFKLLADNDTVMFSTVQTVGTRIRWIKDTTVYYVLSSKVNNGPKIFEKSFGHISNLCVIGNHVVLYVLHYIIN